LIMRSHRALNRDIAERGLDPKHAYTSAVLGGDGRLSPVDEEAVEQQAEMVVQAATKKLVELVVDEPVVEQIQAEVATEPVQEPAVTETAEAALAQLETPGFGKTVKPAEAEPEQQEAASTKKKRGKEKANSPV